MTCMRHRFTSPRLVGTENCCYVDNHSKARHKHRLHLSFYLVEILDLPQDNLWIETHVSSIVLRLYCFYSPEKKAVAKKN